MQSPDDSRVLDEQASDQDGASSSGPSLEIDVRPTILGTEYD
jgi:hypothetical protein